MQSAQAKEQLQTRVQTDEVVRKSENLYAKTRERSNSDSFIDSQRVEQSPLKQTTRQTMVVAPTLPPVVENYREGILQKKSRWVGKWNTRFLVVEGNEMRVYTHHKHEKVRQVENLREFACEWLGKTKKKYFAVRLKPAQKKKRTYTFRVDNSAIAEEWYESFKRACSAARAVSAASPGVLEVGSTPRVRFTELKQLKKIKAPLTEIPKFFQTGFNLLKSDQNWTLVGEMLWKQEDWLKTVICVNGENIFKIYQERQAWDYSVTSYRVLQTIGDMKIALVVIDGKTIPILQTEIYEPPTNFYLCQQSIDHIHYPCNVELFDFVWIKLHTSKDMSLITRVTKMLDKNSNSLEKLITTKFFPALNSFRAFAAVRQFVDKGFKYEDSGSEEDDMQEIEETETENPQVEFGTFFVYGKGGRYEKNPNGGLVFKDKALMSRQKGVLTSMIKKMGSNLLKGKSIMTVSIPVTVFDSKTLLERVAENFLYAPIFLDQAAQVIDDPIQTFKLVVTQIVTLFHLTTEQKKPFNPILGETFEAKIGNFKFMSEQVSHHPPACSFILEGSGCRIEGSHEFFAAMSANSTKARNQGPTKIILPNQTIYYSYPMINIGGTIMGKRIFNWTGVCTIMDLENNLFCELKFNPFKKGGLKGLFGSKNATPSDFFMGEIQRVSSQHIMHDSRARQAIFSDGKRPIQGRQEDVLDVISQVEGYWPSYIAFDGARYWEFDEYRPYKLARPDVILPSDSRHRHDRIWLERNNETESQRVKEEMEDIQRRDRKLRADYIKAQKKASKKAK